MSKRREIKINIVNMRLVASLLNRIGGERKKSEKSKRMCTREGGKEEEKNVIMIIFFSRIMLHLFSFQEVSNEMAKHSHLLFPAQFFAFFSSFYLHLSRVLIAHGKIKGQRLDKRKAKKRKMIQQYALIFGLLIINLFTIL